MSRKDQRGHSVPEVQVLKGYVPGSLRRVAELHGIYYHRHWDIGLFFEAKVATELAAFLGRYDEKEDGFWTASVGRRIEGSITIDAARACWSLPRLRSSSLPW
jgi:hypothetical protein